MHKHLWSKGRIVQWMGSVRIGILKTIAHQEYVWRQLLCSIWREDPVPDLRIVNQEAPAGRGFLLLPLVIWQAQSSSMTRVEAPSSTSSSHSWPSLSFPVLTTSGHNNGSRVSRLCDPHSCPTERRLRVTHTHTCSHLLSVTRCTLTLFEPLIILILMIYTQMIVKRERNYVAVMPVVWSEIYCRPKSLFKKRKTDWCEYS